MWKSVVSGTSERLSQQPLYFHLLRVSSGINSPLWMTPHFARAMQDDRSGIEIECVCSSQAARPTFAGVRLDGALIC